MSVIKDAKVNIKVGEYVIVGQALDGQTKQDVNGVVKICLATSADGQPADLKVVQTIHPFEPTDGFGCEIRYVPETCELWIKDAKGNAYALSDTVSVLGDTNMDLTNHFLSVYLKPSF